MDDPIEKQSLRIINLANKAKNTCLKLRLEEEDLNKVLLDSDMTAEIADLTLALRFAIDQTNWILELIESAAKNKNHFEPFRMIIHEPSTL